MGSSISRSGCPRRLSHTCDKKHLLQQKNGVPQMDDVQKMNGMQQQMNGMQHDQNLQQMNGMQQMNYVRTHPDVPSEAELEAALEKAMSRAAAQMSNTCRLPTARRDAHKSNATSH